MRRAPALCLILAACGAVTFTFKPQKVEQVFDFNNGASGTCQADGKPFGTITYNVRAINEAAGVDPSIGCLNPGVTFGMEAHVLESGVSHTVGDSCASSSDGPRGSITLERIGLAYDWDGGTNRYALECPGTVFDLTQPGEVLSTKLDGCFARLDDAGTEYLRVGYNRHPDKLDVTPEGSCSADACFYFQFSLTLKLLSGTASLSGCP
jgi:hypothetical protein